jgi:UDP-glucose 4-epimerase
MGFPPILQLIRIEDMARALMPCLVKNKAGIYNVAPSDSVALREAVILAGCTRIFIPSEPPGLPPRISQLMRNPAFPPYLLNDFKCPVIIDGRHFANPRVHAGNLPPGDSRLLQAAKNRGKRRSF